MPILAAISGSSGGGRFIPDIPQISYSGIAGTFTINNYNPSLIYTVTGNGYISGNSLIVNVAAGNATINAKTQKGFTSSGSKICYRQNRTYTTTTVPFTQCYNPCGNCRTDVNPHTWSCGCGSGCGDSGGGQWGDCICRGPGYSTTTENSYTGAGYVFSSSGNEWYKVG